MKAVFSNFIYTIKKYRTSGILNILGLTAAFAAFLIIAIQVDFEYSFEKCHTNADRIYRVEGINFKIGEDWPIHSRPFTAAVIESSPHIIAGTLINPYIDEFYVTVDDGNIQRGFKEAFATCNTGIAKMFDFKMLEGQADCLNNPENVMIPKSIARKMFGDKQAVGKQLNLTGSLWSKQDKGFLIVGGVFEDFPDNTQLINCIYTAIAENYAISDWGSSNYFCYVLLDNNISPQEIADNFNKNFDFTKTFNEENEIGIKLTSLPAIYFQNSDPSGKLVKSSSHATPLLLITIGVIIIVIAIINYTNFNMALSPMRMRSINTRKILGNTNTSLRLGIISEGIIMSLVSFILAILVTFILDESNALPFINADINPANNIFPTLITGLIAVVAGTIASIRPAFYMTSYSPALALKGNFGLSPSGKKLRTILIGFQFLTSIVLIITSFFVYKQNLFMQKYTLGYNTDNIAIVELPQSIAWKEKNSFTAAIKDNPDIVGVAFSHQKFGASDNYRTWGAKYKDESINFYSLSVSWNFLDVMDIKVREGKIPDESVKNDSVVSYIINSNLQKKYNIKPGEIIDVEWSRTHRKSNDGRVLSITDDVKFRSLRNQSEDMAFVFNDGNLQSYSYIRIKAGADIRQTVSYIEKIISGFDPAYPVKIEFYDQVFDSLYKQEISTEATISMFSLLAIVISIVGVFGIAMFECEYKRKEIGVRKILGSNEFEILTLLNKDYLLIFIICFIISVPVSYYILNRWLENFTYKTPLDWWGFILAGIPVLLIIILTVSWQSWRAAQANPVDSLKNE